MKQIGDVNANLSNYSLENLLNKGIAMKSTVAVVYRVVDETEDVALEITSECNGEWINISTSSSKKSADWFGILDINIPKHFAIVLGDALIKAAAK
jgi:hypothetical protein